MPPQRANRARCLTPRSTHILGGEKLLGRWGQDGFEPSPLALPSALESLSQGLQEVVREALGDRAFRGRGAPQLHHPRLIVVLRQCER